MDEKQQVETINLMPSWVSLWNIAKNGEFPVIMEEIKKPCIVLDTINEILDKGNKVLIYKDESGEVIIASDDGDENE